MPLRWKNIDGKFVPASKWEEPAILNEIQTKGRGVWIKEIQKLRNRQEQLKNKIPALERDIKRYGNRIPNGRLSELECEVLRQKGDELAKSKQTLTEIARRIDFIMDEFEKHFGVTVEAEIQRISLPGEILRLYPELFGSKSIFRVSRLSQDDKQFLIALSRRPEATLLSTRRMDIAGIYLLSRMRTPSVDTAVERVAGNVRPGPSNSFVTTFARMIWQTIPKRYRNRKRRHGVNKFIKKLLMLAGKKVTKQAISKALSIKPSGDSLYTIPKTYF